MPRLKEMVSVAVSEVNCLADTKGVSYINERKLPPKYRTNMLIYMNLLPQYEPIHCAVQLFASAHCLLYLINALFWLVNILQVQWNLAL